MTKKQQTFGIIAGSVIVAGSVTWILINRSQKKKEVDTIMKYIGGETTSTGTSIVKPEIIASLPEGVFPLKRGDKNKKVAQLQKALNKKYKTSITIDGLFGQDTFDILCDKYWYVCRVATTTYPYYRGRYVDVVDFNNINS